VVQAGRQVRQAETKRQCRQNCNLQVSQKICGRQENPHRQAPRTAAGNRRQWQRKQRRWQRFQRRSTERCETYPTVRGTQTAGNATVTAGAAGGRTNGNPTATVAGNPNAAGR